MLQRSLLAALCCVCLPACSGGGGVTDAGPPPDPQKILGLELGSCFEYTTGTQAQMPPALGAAIESTSATAIDYLPDGGAITGPSLQLTYRVQGATTMEDFLLVAGEDIYLLKRQVAGAETVEYKPAVILARIPLRNGDELSQVGQDEEFDGSSDTGNEAYQLDFNVLSAPAASVTTTYDAGYQIAYVEQPTHHRLDGWTFVPSFGPVQLQGAMAGNLADGGAVSITYTLQSQRTLSAGSVCSSGQ